MGRGHKQKSSRRRTPRQAKIVMRNQDRRRLHSSKVTQIAENHPAIFCHCLFPEMGRFVSVPEFNASVNVRTSVPDGVLTPLNKGCHGHTPWG